MGFVFRRGTAWIFFGLGVKNGFIWRIAVLLIGQGRRQIWAERVEPFQIFHRSAVLTLGLRLIAEEQRPGGGVLTVHAIEAVGEAVGAILLGGVLRRHLQFLIV